MRLRTATPSDEATLWHMLYYASHSDHESGVDPESIRSNPVLGRYVEGWGRDGDLGVIAEESGEAVGAAWLRLPQDEHRGDPSYVDETTPELAVAVLPRYRGRRIGTGMLRRLVASAGGRYPAIVLSVRSGNPAERLYRDLGFSEVGRITNRVGGESVKMILRLP